MVGLVGAGVGVTVGLVGRAVGCTVGVVGRGVVGAKLGDGVGSAVWEGKTHTPDWVDR